MYIQITTRCNMTCAHCCYSCTAEGDDMGLEVFMAAVKLAEDYGEIISIGGGEPTVHPMFWQFLGIAALADCECPPWLATNGKLTKDALRLASLSRRELVSAALSVDPYHEDVDPRVTKAFGKRTHGGGEVIKSGRAGDWGTRETCCCEDILVDPAGNLFACGCKSHALGTVFAPEIPGEWEVAFGVEQGECPNHGARAESGAD